MALGLTLGLALAGCSGFGSADLPTGSIEPQPQKAAAPRVDPACVALQAQIDDLRKAGITEKLEKAGQKKGKVTADEAAKAAQLIKANDEFAAKCPRPRPIASAGSSAGGAPTAAPAVAGAPLGPAAPAAAPAVAAKAPSKAQ